MTWDMGIWGVGTLAGLSLGFGVIAQVITWQSATHWMWLIGAVTFFICGAFISEVIFGWATAADLQPNIDGLSLDETLLALLPSILVVIGAWYLTRTTHEATAA
jgi:heme/copper-type cytochrome/quinol oxidase subunit 2